MGDLLDRSRESVHLAVDFFDDTERERLLRYPTSARLKEIVSGGVTVNVAQFLTYYLFHKKRPGKEGYRSYTQLAKQIARADAELDDWVVYRDGTFMSASDVLPQDRCTIERVGEAAALSVASQIHQLHDADWDHIPEHPGPQAIATFDYECDPVSASDGRYIVQVEAKGTGVEDAAALTANVRSQKSRLDEKKKKIKTLEQAGTYPHPADLRYGIISSLGRRGQLHCWLTDPPGESGPDPRRYRLLARLRFMCDWISFLSVRSQFAASLATRLRALHALRDPFELAGVPLLKGNGEPFNATGLEPFERTPSLFAHLCRVIDGPAVGTVLWLPGDRLFFLGVQRSIFEMAAAQTFEGILGYWDAGGSVEKRLRCVVPRGRAKRMGLERLDESANRRSGYVAFNARGTLHYSHGASVFGVVLPEARL